MAVVEKPVNFPKFERPLRDMDLDELRVAAKHVAELEAHPGWLFVKEMVERVERRSMDALVMNGRQPEHAEYAGFAGTVRGLRVARDAAQSVLYVAQERDRLERERLEAETGPGEG